MNTRHKTSAMCKVPFLKKSGKNGHFEPFFVDFFRNCSLDRAGVFVLYSVHQNFSYLNQHSDNFSPEGFGGF